MSLIKKTDLNSIFKNNLDYVNNEYVYKAKTKEKPIFIDDFFAEDKSLTNFLEKHLVTIVTPDTFKGIINKVKKENIRILQSSYENGRVLESSEKILIDWVENIVTLKWIWATDYFRETGAVNPFIFQKKEYELSENEKKSLQKFPFYETSGIYDKDKALEELERSQLLQEMWIDTEKILGIYELEEVLWKKWEYISIEKLKKDKILLEWSEPVILLRAHKTNIRILDFIMLVEYWKKESLTPLLNHILEESEKHWQTKNLDEYIQKLFTTILKNRLNLIWKFDKLNWDFWQDVFRNFSAFGEELDLWTMKPMEDNHIFENPHYFIDHYKKQLHTIFNGLSLLINSIEKNTEHKINHEELAENIYNIILSWFKANKNNIKEYYDKNHWKKWKFGLWNGFNWFLSIFLKKTFSSFIDYSNRFEYKILIQQKLENDLNKKD